MLFILLKKGRSQFCPNYTCAYVQDYTLVYEIKKFVYEMQNLLIKMESYGESWHIKI